MAGLPTLGLPHGALKKRTSHVLMKRTCRVSTTEESGAPCDFSVEIGLVLICVMTLLGMFPPAGAGGAPAGSEIGRVWLKALEDCKEMRIHCWRCREALRIISWRTRLTRIPELRV